MVILMVWFTQLDRGPKGNHGLYLKAWDRLCLPKSRSSGKLQDGEMNLAFLAKWGGACWCDQSLAMSDLRREAKRKAFHVIFLKFDSGFRKVVKSTHFEEGAW
uniref:Uncharacterized protein n=1 Tax=Cannabis sativa TaxID=3483 RepID=A0A803P0Y9_CANSA